MTFGVFLMQFRLLIWSGFIWGRVESGIPIYAHAAISELKYRLYRKILDTHHNNATKETPNLHRKIKMISALTFEPKDDVIGVLEAMSEILPS